MRKAGTRGDTGRGSRWGVVSTQRVALAQQFASTSTLFGKRYRMCEISDVKCYNIIDGSAQRDMATQEQR
jgi:hypothetical protein